MKIVKLIPKKGSKFLFGEGYQDTSREFFTSDSLVSAIYSLGKEMGITLDINIFPKLSSLFYGVSINGREDIYFIPKPMFMDLREIKIKNQKGEKIEDRKINKKVKWVSLDALRNYIETPKIDFYISGEILHIHPLRIERVYTKELEVKNKINYNKGVTEEGSLYTIEVVQPETNVFFYFIIEKLTEELKKILTEGIPINGIGGNRSSGYGVIKEVIIEDLPSRFNSLFFDINANFFINLGILFPSSAEEFNSVKEYNLYISRGFVGGKYYNIRRKSIWGIKEGATILKKVNGKIVKKLAKNDDEVFRDGRPLLLTISYKGDGEND